MDPQKRLVRAASSNVGHCLASRHHRRGSHSARRRPPVRARHVQRLGREDALGATTPTTTRVSYHRGTVWAVEQATILFGLRRFGFDARAHDLARARCSISRSSTRSTGSRNASADTRAASAPTPGAYPQANAPQLWNATAFPLVVQSLLGMLPLAHYELLVHRPGAAGVAARGRRPRSAGRRGAR